MRYFKVDGTTYDPCDGKIRDCPRGNMEDENPQMIAKIAAVCNDASIAHSTHHYSASNDPSNAHPGHNRCVDSGMTTEAALKQGNTELAMVVALACEEINGRDIPTEIGVEIVEDVIPFD